MLIKKIFQSLTSNFIFFIVILISFIPIITAYYIIKFYLFTVKLSIHQLNKGIVVQFYQYLTTKQPNHHVAFH
ncbi:hypothetical protein C6B37_01420 [Candidatus Phytoplasma phoenicium]|uniref:Uncharacterized protein n=1 Tax=Candidatus Phytoplasma phoenicium TaxID=198422 RepID=A0A2S8NU24_9MOLU|nr:hypothetical protein C6B37_01895 [Candidatus Phytoplasma phoenicium]PQP79507.1 hypothetical protein C6B37_01765 [Candidatus Phytoplasma phoenicium]PQP79727.1 hypothetical protein C6B37_01420 [Candidatus Phytoplasma phoenicium]